MKNGISQYLSIVAFGCLASSSAFAHSTGFWHVHGLDVLLAAAVIVSGFLIIAKAWRRRLQVIAKRKRKFPGR